MKVNSKFQLFWLRKDFNSQLSRYSVTYLDFGIFESKNYFRWTKIWDHPKSCVFNLVPLVVKTNFYNRPACTSPQWNVSFGNEILPVHTTNVVNSFFGHNQGIPSPFYLFLNYEWFFNVIMSSYTNRFSATVHFGERVHAIFRALNVFRT